MSTVHGINISDSSIELVSIKKGVIGKPRVVASARVKVPEEVIENGIIIDAKLFVESLQHVMASATPKAVQGGDVILSVPESQMYSRTLQFPNDLSLEDIRNGLKFQIAKYIPFEEGELYYDALPIAKHADHQEVMVVAVPVAVVDAYLQGMKDVGLSVERVTLESLSTAQAIMPISDPIKVLLDMGARTTNVSIFRQDHLLMSVTIPSAGYDITHALMRTFSWTEVEAESKKKKLGIAEHSNNQQNIQPEVIKVMNPIVLRLKDIIHHIEERYSMLVEQVLLTGGTSQLPGLQEYLATELDRSITRGSLLIDIKSNGILSEDVVVYHNAIGLAMNHINSSGLSINLVNKRKNN